MDFLDPELAWIQYKSEDLKISDLIDSLDEGTQRLIKQTWIAGYLRGTRINIRQELADAQQAGKTTPPQGG